jgi:hypothetical protein
VNVRRGTASVCRLSTRRSSSSAASAGELDGGVPSHAASGTGSAWRVAFRMAMRPTNHSARLTALATASDPRRRGRTGAAPRRVLRHRHGRAAPLPRGGGRHRRARTVSTPAQAKEAVTRGRVGVLIDDSNIRRSHLRRPTRPSTQPLRSGARARPAPHEHPITSAPRLPPENHCVRLTISDRWRSSVDGVCTAPCEVSTTSDKCGVVAAGVKGSWVQIPPSRQREGFRRSQTTETLVCVQDQFAEVEHAAHRTLDSAG